MIKMKAEYAQRLLEGTSTFGHMHISCHDNMLVIDDNENYFRTNYYGTQLKDGKLQIDNEGFVIFKAVEPIVDDNTRWKF